MVEAALIFPVFFLLVFGAVEYGLLFRDTLTVSTTSRSGGRAASAQANNTTADQAILQAMIPPAQALSGGLAAVSRIVVFFATCQSPLAGYTSQSVSRCAAGAQPIQKLSDMTDANCTSAAATTGSTDLCNIYTGTALTTAFANNNANWGTCNVPPASPRKPDTYWCSDRRIAKQSTGTDYVGIHIEYTHRWVTGLFGTSKALADDIVFRVEPQAL